MNRIAVLGSTGSIGTRTLQVARHLGNRVEVVALAAGHNTTLLSRQIGEFHPRLYHSLNPYAVESAESRSASLLDIVSDEEVDTVVIATSGNVGLEPTLLALRNGKTVLLSNKEVLVMAGELVMAASRESGAHLLPVDSEHSALWQCLRGESGGVGRLLLTASGGPFHRYSVEQLASITPADALAHPVWSMGQKITIDSATLMNKGLEVIEAHWLFDTPFESIDIVVHPDCIVHSLVEFVDGTVKAQLSQPDMALPIQYALSYPDRMQGFLPPLSWDKIRTLTFEPVDDKKFPCLRLAREAGKAGMTFPAVLCGADEVAVDLFLHGSIRFTDIASIVHGAIEAHQPVANPDLAQIIEADDWARRFAASHHAHTQFTSTSHAETSQEIE